MDAQSSFYLGIDFSGKSAMISYFQMNKKEPETISMTSGEENYEIPVVLARRRETGQWYFGEEALRLARNSELSVVDQLLERSLNGENLRMGTDIYKAEDLFTLFLKKLIFFPKKIGIDLPIDKIGITVEKFTKDHMELFWRIFPKIGISAEQFFVIDHKESFYYFTLSQPELLWRGEVFLYEAEGEQVHSFCLKRDTRTKPQVVSIQESQKYVLGEDRDTEFLKILKKEYEDKTVTATYLLGDGFAGGWLKQSTTFLCRGRKAFLGNNLYSKGACYAAKAREMGEKWPFLYMGENEMKFHLSLKVRKQGEVSFFHLISAGKNWFEAKKSCEMILSDKREIDFWKQLPNSREAKIETLELTDLPVRPERTTRIRITATPISDDKVDIEIKDLGFGELFKSSEKTWHYLMSM